MENGCFQPRIQLLIGVGCYFWQIINLLLWSFWSFSKIYKTESGKRLSGKTQMECSLLFFFFLLCFLFRAHPESSLWTSAQPTVVGVWSWDVSNLKWFVSSSETFVSFPSKAEAEAERAAHYNFLRSLSVVQRDFPDHSVVQINPTTTERKCWNDEKNPWPGKVWSICCRSNPFTSKKNSLLRNVNITLAARSCFVEQRWGIRVF